MRALQACSQNILLGSAFEEKVDLLILQYSPGAVEELIIVWSMLIAHIHEGLYWYIFLILQSAFYLLVPAKPTRLFMQIILYCITYTLLCMAGETTRQVRPWHDQYFDFIYKFDKWLSV